MTTGPTRLTWRVRLYVLSVTVAGPLSAAGIAATAGFALGPQGWSTAVVLLGLLAVADRFPLQLARHVQINVSTVAILAVVLAMPLGLCGLLAYAAAVVSHLTRPTNRADALESGFNAGQLALTVGVGSIAYDLLRGSMPGPIVGDLGPLGAIVTVAALVYLVNTLLVAIAAAMQLERGLGSVLLSGLWIEFREHVVLSALGLVAAVLATDHPWALPIFVLPVLLVRSAQEDGVRVRAATRAALATLVDVVELSDTYTAGHSQRVADLARALALRVGMNEEEADLVESAGRVHDLGKVAIDGALLSKPGALTTDERIEMERHPALGAEVIANLMAYDGVYQMVRHHHERWDGCGYPDRLSAEGIPLGARILAVADTYDALTSDRPYRSGMSLDHAHAILRGGAGTQWDPAVVAAMIAIHDERRHPLPSTGERPLAAVA